MSDTSDDKNLPVPAGPVTDHEPRKERRKTPRGKSGASKGEYAAQLLSGGEKRGLRGGPETLDRAKSTYLQSEYSGPNDRRPRPGLITKTDI